MDARTAQAIAKAACDRQRLLHASNRLRAAEMGDGSVNLKNCCVIFASNCYTEGRYYFCPHTHSNS